MTTSTTISLASDGTLFLELPDHNGTLRQINLAEGQAEAILRTLLREQRRKAQVGKKAGATWRFLLEGEMLESLARAPVTKVPMGATRQSKTNASTEELGL